MRTREPRATVRPATGSGSAPDSPVTPGSGWAASRRPGLLAATLLLVSALLQGIAAAQRWLLVDPAVVGDDRTIEDHLFDYAFPAEPWVSVGSAAILFGIGFLLVAAAVASLGVAATVTRLRVGGVWAVVLLTAGPFALIGLHALVSGILGRPTPLELVVATFGALPLGVLQLLGMAVLAVLVARRSVAWALGLVFLVGTTVLGYVFAVFVAAPWIVGYTSYDTTPWSEAVVAAFTAMAAVAVLAGSFRPAPAWRAWSPPPVGVPQHG